MFTCQVHVLYPRAEEEDEEEVQIYFLSTKTMVNIKKESYLILFVVQHASHDNEQTIR